MPAVAKQDPIDVEIGERVHQYLWRNRVSLNAMAPLVGMSQQSLGRKVRGESAWTAGELHRLAGLLRVSVGWLYGETSEEPVRPKGLEPLTFWSDVCRAQQSITCPRCGRTSYHPDDVREGYCGACHDWTAVRTDDLALTA